MASNLSARTVKASAWMLAAVFFIRIADFILLLLLARILAPADFALIALAMIFVQITEAVLELPISQALIRAPVVRRSMLHTAFTLSLLRALVISVLIFAMAPAAATYFNDERLLALMMVIAAGPALRGMVNPRMVLFYRRLDYRRDAVLLATGKVASLILALAVAWATKSYWALAVGVVVTPLTMVIVSYAYAPYRPRLSLSEWSTFADMVSWNTASQICTAISWQIDIFVLGRAVPAETLGRYSMAQQLASTPHKMIALPALRPFMATFSALRTPDALRRGCLKASSAVLMLTIPILATIGLLAEPIIVILFDDKWRPAAPYLELLAYVAAITIAFEPIVGVALVLDRTRFIALRSFAELVVKTPLLIVGLAMFGIYGVIGATAIGRFVFVIISMYSAKVLIGLRYSDQLAALVRPLLGASALALVIAPLRSIISYENTILLILTTAAVASIGMLAFCVAVYMLWRMASQPAGLEKMAHDIVSDRLSKLLKIARSRNA